MHEKQLRIRYIRVLDEFLTRTMSLLKLENFNYELFRERTLKNYEDLKKVDPIDLHSPYYSQLKAFIDKTLLYLETHSDSFENERAALLKDANLLQKEKKKNSYSKDKHKHKKFDDGY